ncbi:MAG: SDR family NAD(P)-dependent oxidoreductase [Acidobacteria bacterium]|nr:SDR family NAD(P)-dependent oxidoreductase [Acidobacteriota bacterium]
MSAAIRPLALVTGASAGIGAEFCRQLAARGHDLVMVARRGERLAALARELETRHGVTTWPVAVDLGEPDAITRLLTMLPDAPVTHLVNNAGYGVPGRYLDSAFEVHARFQRVMSESVAELTHALLPAMLRAGHGRVVNVASLAGLLPGSAGHTLYGASKAWMIRWSESLAFEYRGRGVGVCALCPGFTYSEFHDVTGTRAQVARLPRWLWMSADEVVAAALAASDAGQLLCIPGRVNRLIARAARWLPVPALHYLSERESRRVRDLD